MHRTAAVGLVAAASCFAAVSGGCSSAAHDRVGGMAGVDPVVLTLAGHDAGAGIRDWIDAVQRLSGGSLRIELRPGWRHAEVDYERDTVADVRAGKVDLATIPARAFDAMSVTTFQALLAPFLIDSYALQREALAGDLPARMLAGVRPLGVAGVALLPGPLERTLGDRMLPLGPDDYRFTAVGVRPSALTSASFRALGATARPLAPGDRIDPLNGVEQSLPEIVANRYGFETPGRTLALNATLWPRIHALVMNPAAYAALTPGQRDALRRAGQAAVAPSVRRLLRAEQDAERVLCRPPHDDENLFQLIWTTPSSLAGLRRAVRPVYRRLERDAAAHAAIAAIRAMRRDTAPALGIICRGGSPHPFRPPAVPHLRVTGDLRQVGPREWSGAATSDRFGRGRLIVRGGPIRFRGFPTGGTMTVRAVFPRGQLRGWIRMTIAPGPRAAHAWAGSGIVFKTSPRLRRYRPASLRFRGVTNRGEPHHVHGGFVTDAATGLR